MISGIIIFYVIIGAIVCGTKFDHCDSVRTSVAYGFLWPIFGTIQLIIGIYESFEEGF